MRINITGRHVEITDALHEHIEKKLDKMSSYFDDIIDVRVVLSVEKYRQFAEVTISGRGNMRAHSEEATDDMYVSIDKAFVFGVYTPWINYFNVLSSKVI